MKHAHIRLILLSLMLFSSICFPVYAEIIEESGSLLEFFHGHEDGCAYDNWVSHIVEGIARAGFNDHGPVELDRQTNGFGRYQMVDSLDNPAQVILDFYNICSFLLVNNPDAADSILADSEFSRLYHIVRLDDNGHIYWLLRENLDDDFSDNNGTDFREDDVNGSFYFGWGLYIFNSVPSVPQVVLEAPHSCDDYITPAMAIDAFLTIGARALFVSGVGREVVWTGHDVYNNELSLCDPSRNENTPFQAAHRASVDGIDEEFVVQIHSYDSALHANLPPSELASYPDYYPNPPLMDFNQHNDIISRLPEYPVEANTIGHEPHSRVRLSSYLSVWYNRAELGAYRYQNRFAINHTSGLPGAYTNRQMIYSFLTHHHLLDDENWLHIEHDEFPNIIREDILDFYQAGSVPTYENYAPVVKYYRPIYVAIRDYYTPATRRNVPEDYYNIQGGIDAASSYDTVVVQPGEYFETVDFKGKSVVVGSLMMLTGDRYYIDRTIVNGEAQTSVVTFQENENRLTQLIGFTIRNGNTAESGGGIRCVNAQPSIRNCIITGNSAGVGGGVSCQSQSNMLLENCIIYDNTAFYGGGLSFWDSNPRVVGCTISANTSATEGGGLLCFNSRAVFVNTIISENDPHEIHLTGNIGSNINFAWSDIYPENGAIIIEQGDISWFQGNLRTDPHFADPESGDFHLLHYSPCIDAGTGLYSWRSDTLLNMTEEDYCGEAPDMGALEFHPQGISDPGWNTPARYVLLQAFPNPFNHQATLSFNLPHPEHITLNVYDLSGKQVAKMIDAKLQPGAHRLTWNACNAPNGTYIARILSENSSESITLNLIK